MINIVTSLLKDINRFIISLTEYEATSVIIDFSKNDCCEIIKKEGL